MHASLLPILCASTVARANVSVVPMIIDMAGHADTISQFRVSSQSKEIQYLTMTVYRVDAPATKDERNVLVDAVAGEGLIASPQRIVLPPGASRVVRLVQFAAPDVETVYRVFVSPQRALGAQESNLHSFEKMEKPKVDISINWGVLIYARPLHGQPSMQLDASRDYLSNNGNVRVRVDRIGRCKIDPADHCQWRVVSRNVFPGQRLALPMSDASHPVVRAEYKPDNDGIVSMKNQTWDSPSP